jgi:hypothetical protein
MDELVYQGIPYILSAANLLSLWLAGNKNRLAWWIMLVAQVPWFYYNVFQIHAYGFLVLTFVSGAIAVRNLVQWNSPREQDQECFKDQPEWSGFDDEWEDEWS